MLTASLLPAQRYQNSLLSRFREGLIPDLYAFFRETWAVALFHDRFRLFVNETEAELARTASVDHVALSHCVSRVAVAQDPEQVVMGLALYQHPARVCAP